MFHQVVFEHLSSFISDRKRKKQPQKEKEVKNTSSSSSSSSTSIINEITSEHQHTPSPQPPPKESKDPISSDLNSLVFEYILSRQTSKLVALVKKNPRVLSALLEGKDSHGRIVRGYPIQIAGMAGECRLTPRKGMQRFIPREFSTTEEKTEAAEDGLIHELAKAGGLSESDVTAQLAPIFSPEAMKENEARIQRVVTVVKDFGKTLLETRLPERKGKTDQERKKEFETAQAICKPAIDVLRNTLKKLISQEVISSAYIFDTHILLEAMNSFNDPDGLSTLKTDLFFVHAIGTLQSLLTVRDKQLMDWGIVRYNGCVFNIVDDEKPKHCESPDLGVKFYVGGWGQKSTTTPTGGEYHEMLNGLMDLALMKNENIIVRNGCPLPPPREYNNIRYPCGSSWRDDAGTIDKAPSLSSRR
jgi:hypothetical protein